MAECKLRHSVFNLNAISAYHRTTSLIRQRLGEEFHWWRKVEIEVALSPEDQLADRHPTLVRRLKRDYPQLSLRRGGLKYGDGMDFLNELQRGGRDISLGVVYKQVSAQVFDDVSSLLGYGDHSFRWLAEPKKIDKKVTVYTVYCLHEIKPPAEFFSAYGLALGYLNAVMEGKQFALTSRIDDFIRHRLATNKNNHNHKG